MVQIKNIIAFLTKDLEPISNTVDKLMFGDPDQHISTVATAFTVNADTILEANRLGVQLLITHEGLFYSHREMVSGLEQQTVYHKKVKLIEDSKLAVYRYHDYIHKYFPDPITCGLIEKLEWSEENLAHQPYSAVVTLKEPQTVAQIASHIKNKLHINSISLTGNEQLSCSKIGILVGFRGGGENAIPLIEQFGLDLLIVGEGQEWETAEYITDLNQLYRPMSMLTIGHMPSEAPGMESLAIKIQQNFPQIKSYFLSNKHKYINI